MVLHRRVVSVVVVFLLWPWHVMVLSVGRSLGHSERVIVSFDPHWYSGEAVHNKLARWQLGQDSLVYSYKHVANAVVLQGLSDAEIMRLIEDESVVGVETDQIAYGTAIGDFTRADGNVTLGHSRQHYNRDATEQMGPKNWGLDRIDAQYGLDSRYRYSYTGQGVDIYILDSGLRRSHVDFSGRANICQNFVDDEPCEDTFGHGTHVAAIASGLYSGVAKEANIIDVKVLNYENAGYYSSIIAALDWVVGNHQGPSVVNMSLGATYSSAMNSAVARATDAGVVVVTSAGNDYGQDSCDQSPASAEGAITAASSSISLIAVDFRSDFSNVGSCVNVFAPGERIDSASWLSDDGSTRTSGTSMSAPFVTGVAALYLQKNPSWTPAQVAAAIASNGVHGVVRDARTAPNILLNTEDLIEVRQTSSPTSSPSGRPSLKPSPYPTTPQPTASPSPVPSSLPSKKPSARPTLFPTSMSSTTPSPSPTAYQSPIGADRSSPTAFPSPVPSSLPSKKPSSRPTLLPTPMSSTTPSSSPTAYQSPIPADRSSPMPVDSPSLKPTFRPSTKPSKKPTNQPTTQPSLSPTLPPLAKPSTLPSTAPTSVPTPAPSDWPTNSPSSTPTTPPSQQPSNPPSSPAPTANPSETKSESPTLSPCGRFLSRCSEDYECCSGACFEMLSGRLFAGRCRRGRRG